MNRVPVKSESSTSGSSSESSSDSEDSGEEERRAKLKLLEQELIAMQEKMRKLVEESTTKKKAKKKQKEKHKEKHKTPNSNITKPVGHGPVTKSNSLVADNVSAGVQGVTVSADVKVTPDLHHVPPSKSLHVPAGPANANSAKPAKSKGKIFICFRL